MAKKKEIPWLRQTGETVKAYAAFAIYRDLGVERNKTAAFRRGYHGDAKTYPSWYAKWVKKWKWDARATAYDQHTAAKTLEAKDKASEADVVDWVKRQTDLRELAFKAGTSLVNTGRQMQKIAEDLIKGGAAKLAASDAPAFAREARQVMAEGVKMARLAAELATEIHEHRYDIDWDNITEDEQRRIANGEEPHIVAPHAATIVH